MPIEVGPGYVSPSSGGYQAPGASAPAPSAAPAPVLFPRDTFQSSAPSAPVLAPASSGGALVGAKSFLSNLWDQFLGPMVKGVWSFITGLFGRSGSAPASVALPVQ